MKTPGILKIFATLLIVVGLVNIADSVIAISQSHGSVIAVLAIYSLAISFCMAISGILMYRMKKKTLPLVLVLLCVSFLYVFISLNIFPLILIVVSLVFCYAHRAAFIK